jgi:biotin synthase
VTAGEFQPTTGDLLGLDGEQTELHARAAQTAREHFGRKVFIRGVVEVSNFCRENCHYCGMRRDNRSLDRYRAEVDRLADRLIHHRPASLTDVNLQAGEDPVGVREVALPLIRLLRRHSPLGISVCLGTLQDSLYEALREAGAEIYILKFETGEASHYERCESPGTLPERIAHIRSLSASGWFVSSGFIAGLPGSDVHGVLQNARFAAGLPLHGCSVSPFVPGPDTPFADETNGSVDLTLNCMAILRLLRPDWVIPAVSALNIGEPGSGYRRGLRTGANLVTINLTPPDLRADYVLYKPDRFIMTEERILEAITAEGLVPSTSGLADHFRRTASRAKVPVVSAA